MATVRPPECAGLPWRGCRDLRDHELPVHGLSLDAQRRTDAVYYLSALRTEARLQSDRAFTCVHSSLSRPLLPVIQLAEVASGLTYLHAQKVVHADVHGVRASYVHIYQTLSLRRATSSSTRMVVLCSRTSVWSP
jgi:hypothetical protein